MSDDYAFSIDKSACLQAHQAIGKAATGIQEALSRIDADGAVLLANWDGEAREAFLTRQTRWNADADAILQKLRQINAGLEQAVYIYDHADRKGAQMISGN